MTRRTYKIINENTDDKAIRCMMCGKTSSNKGDIDQLYCGNCGRFHKEMEMDMQNDRRSAMIEGIDEGSPIIRSIMAFLLHLRDPSNTVKNCYKKADEFLVELKRNLEDKVG